MENLPLAPQGLPNPELLAVGVPVVVVPAPPYTLFLDMNTCVFTSAKQDQTFATEVLMDEFKSCKYMSNEDIAERAFRPSQV